MTAQIIDIGSIDTLVGELFLFLSLLRNLQICEDELQNL